ncbi:MAG TPA: hypothetical protein VGC56_00015 [Allosphingosinicella sp.]|jgi:hypothetical protein
MIRIRCLSLIAAALTLSACATARLHTDAELADVTRVCGLAAGELVQEEEDPRILFLVRPKASPRERGCAMRWAKRNHLHLAYVEGIELKDR